MTTAVDPGRQTREGLLRELARYVPRSLHEDLESRSSLISRVLEIAERPLSRTHVNQLLHLAGIEPGISQGFLRYYFLTAPIDHPYALATLVGEEVPALDDRGIASVDQLRWGTHRFFVDSLLYFGDLRRGYDYLSGLSLADIEAFFAPQRVPSEDMARRGPAFPFHDIPADDRYLIAEIACRAYSPVQAGGTVLLIEQELLKAYHERGGGRVDPRKLFDSQSPLAASDPQMQMMLEFAADEFADDVVDSEEEIRAKIRAVAARFAKAREQAIANTRLYLSIVDELDVYVATSMRKRADFRDMSRDCDLIFRRDGLARFHLRYFDPTLSAAEGHEDKGLIECLMVKCAKALLYFAGDADSFGKDAEVTMALSLGKPVVILCPNTPKGRQRMKFFRDVHPLSRMVRMDRGVAVGAMVTDNPATAGILLERLFGNRMEYDLDHEGDGYLRLRERLTGSVVRLQTNDQMLRETFLQNYRGIL